MYKGKWRDVFANEELRFYLSIILGVNYFDWYESLFYLYGSGGISFRDAFFQVSSIMTTTGYATADFDQWPTFSKSILFLLMFIGGSAGSTGGGIKVIRILVLLKLIKREILKIFHPRAVIPIKIQNKPLTSDVTASIYSFFCFIYSFIYRGNDFDFFRKYRFVSAQVRLPLH